MLLSRVLGFGGSSSLMIRRISSYAAAGEPLAVERRRAGEQLVQEHAEAVDVAAVSTSSGVDLRLLGAHVQRRADHLTGGGCNIVFSVSLLADGLGHAEVDHLDHRLAVVGATRMFDGFRSRWMIPF